MRIATCQVPDVRQDIDRALGVIEQSAADAGKRGARLVCFPEGFLQGYTSDEGLVAEWAIDLSSPDFARVLARLAPLTPVIVFGLIEREADRFFNAAVVIRRGVLVGAYRKRHLLAGERRVFTPGDRRVQFEIDGVTCGVHICYDMNSPQLIRESAVAGAEVILCPANNMMPRATAEHLKLVHHAVRCQRARESRVWIVSADVAGERDGRVSFGPTSIIDPAGIILDHVPTMTTGMAAAEIEGSWRD